MVGSGEIAGMPISKLKGGFLHRGAFGKFAAGGFHAHAKEIVVSTFAEFGFEFSKKGRNRDSEVVGQPRRWLGGIQVRRNPLQARLQDRGVFAFAPAGIDLSHECCFQQSLQGIECSVRSSARPLRFFAAHRVDELHALQNRRTQSNFQTRGRVLVRQQCGLRIPIHPQEHAAGESFGVGPTVGVIGPHDQGGPGVEPGGADLGYNQG